MNEIRDLLIANQKYLIVLIVFILLDMLSGCINACLHHNLKSSVFREGLLKKCLELIVVVLSFSLAWCSAIPELGQGTTYCLVVMEAYSILENIAEYVPIPDVLKNFLGKGDSNNGTN